MLDAALRHQLLQVRANVEPRQVPHLLRRVAIDFRHDAIHPAPIGERVVDGVLTRLAVRKIRGDAIGTGTSSRNSPFPTSCAPIHARRLRLDDDVGLDRTGDEAGVMGLVVELAEFLGAR